MSLTNADMDHILSVINISWVQGTCETYGTGLLVFHTFGDTCSIPDSQCYHCWSSCSFPAAQACTQVPLLPTMSSGQGLGIFYVANHSTQVKATLDGITFLLVLQCENPSHSFSSRCSLLIYSARLKGKHTSKNLAAALRDVLENWDLDCICLSIYHVQFCYQLGAITADNVSPNDVMVVELGKTVDNFQGRVMHIRCLDHSLNLMAKMLEYYEPSIGIMSYCIIM